VSSNVGTAEFGLGLLFQSRQVKKMVSSYVGENKVFESQYLRGELEIELNPMGTLAERLKAGGSGIPAFYTPAGHGTLVSEGGFAAKLRPDGTPELLSRPREVREFGGKKYVMETAIVGDFALVKAYKGDTKGNLVFRGTAGESRSAHNKQPSLFVGGPRHPSHTKGAVEGYLSLCKWHPSDVFPPPPSIRPAPANFNPEVAKAGRVCIAEVEHLVEPGAIRPDEVHLPGVYVHRIFQGLNYEKVGRWQWPYLGVRCDAHDHQDS
jgi:acyl CoA:acetate/3-ketoacid CoA transferase alpha subunit